MSTSSQTSSPAVGITESNAGRPAAPALLPIPSDPISPMSIIIDVDENAASVIVYVYDIVIPLSKSPEPENVIPFEVLKLFPVTSVSS